MNNPLLEFQTLQAFLREKTLELGLDGFWEWVADLDSESRDSVIDAMSEPAFGLRDHQILPLLTEQAWHWNPVTATKEFQLTKDGLPVNWRTWYLRMGRGAGKTHAAATNAHLLARYLYPGMDGMLVGPDHKHVREVMIEGDSGLLKTAPADFMPTYQPMYSRVVWPNGSKAMIYTSDNPQAIRGPSLYWAWGDELAKWKSEESYKNLLSTLRNKHEFGNRLILTTSPISSKKWLRAIEADPSTITTTATSFANSVGLDDGALAAYQRDVDGGSKRSREEYLGEWVEEGEQLWTLQDLDLITVPPVSSLKDFSPELDSRLLSIDPGGKRDETGISLIGKKGEQFWVLGDFSTRGSKAVWEAIVLDIAKQYLQSGDRVIVETNAHNDADVDLRRVFSNAGLSISRRG